MPGGDRSARGGEHTARGGEHTAPNAGRAFALVLVDELARHGVTDAVLAPGSRSTPVALALHEHPGVRLHVRVDERSAAFLALGLARGSGRPVPVLCTSGTAVAHLHAAVLEADQSRVPLLLLTSDRPPELRGVGANQTVDQLGVYGAAVRWWCDVGVPEPRPGAVRYWRSLTSRAVAVARGHSGGPAGPVHLNLPLREPLVPVDDGVGFGEPLDGRADRRPWTASERAAAPLPDPLRRRLAAVRRGVVLAGDGVDAAGAGGAGADAVIAFAERNGWPLVAEPHSNARRGGTALRCADALLRSEAFVDRNPADLVLVVGRAGLSRAVLGWLEQTPHVVVDADGSWWDPTRSAREVVRCDLTDLQGVDAPAAAGWAEAWLAADGAAGASIDAVLDEAAALSEPRAARDLVAALPDGAALVVASSLPIRHLDLTMRPRAGVRIVANRGVSGIDGFVSTALGVAAAYDGPTWALAGDLSLVHDVNGFIADDRAPVTFVVLDNDGGGIFSTLPQATGDPAAFERLFGTPPGVDLAATCAAYGVGHCRAQTPDDVVRAAATAPEDVRVVQVRTERPATARLLALLRQEATAAVDTSLTSR